MEPLEAATSSVLKARRSTKNLRIGEHTRTGVNSKSAEKLLRTTPPLPKTDARYWLRPGKLRKPAGSANYGLQVMFKGRRVAFTTRTGNREVAARIAAGIYNDLLLLGVDGTLTKHRAQRKVAVDRIATIGEWIEAARKVSEANAATFDAYAASLRLIVGQVLAVRKNKARFGPKRGGAAAYRAEIEAASLEVLTPDALQRWRLDYVAQAKNPTQERSRKTSCNSTIRQARSLFAPKVARFLPHLRLPEPLPFAGVEFFPRQSARYFSRIDPRALLEAAHRELAKVDTPAFLAMLLALSAGLRRGEIDSLCWHQVDCERELIRVETTEMASLKTSDARAEVPIDCKVAALLRGFKAKAGGPSAFVIDANGSNSGARVWGQHYRADAVFTRLNNWLRMHGVEARKPLHELRKELGALVTAEHGIYAASRVLRHSTVATTAAHYSDLKTRPVVNVGEWLPPENVVEMRHATEPVANMKKRRKRA